MLISLLATTLQLLLKQSALGSVGSLADRALGTTMTAGTTLGDQLGGAIHIYLLVLHRLDPATGFSGRCGVVVGVLEDVGDHDLHPIVRRAVARKRRRKVVGAGAVDFIPFSIPARITQPMLRTVYRALAVAIVAEGTVLTARADRKSLHAKPLLGVSAGR